MGSHSKAKTVVAVVLVALLLLGVAAVARHHGDTSASSAAAATIAPKGHRHVRVPKGFNPLADTLDGVVVDAPATWRTPDLTTGSYADMLRAFAADNPEFASIIQQRVANSAAPVGLFALDPVSRATLVIESAPIPGGADLSTLPNGLRARYTELGIALVGTDTVQLPLGRALRASLRFVTAGKELVASQYFVANGPKLVTLTIQEPAGNDPAVLNEQIAHTLDRLG